MQMGKCGILVDILDESVIAAICAKSSSALNSSSNVMWKLEH